MAWMSIVRRTVEIRETGVELKFKPTTKKRGLAFIVQSLHTGNYVKAYYEFECTMTC